MAACSYQFNRYIRAMNIIDTVAKLFNRKPIDWTSLDSCIIFAFGQSNSANYGPKEARNKVRYSGPVCELRSNGLIKPLNEPQQTASGNGSSVWPRVAEGLIQQEMYKNVLVVSVGVGSTYVRQWTPVGDCWIRVATAMGQLKSLGIAPTYVCYHQGESDVHAMPSTEADYKDNLLLMVDGVRQYTHAPIFIAGATYFMGRTGVAVKKAQRLVPEICRDRAVFAGPDTDLLGSGFRLLADGAHMNEMGLSAHARAWVDTFYWHRSGKI